MTSSTPLHSSSPARTLLLTGATGYLGSHLARVLRARGWRVLGLARSTSKVDALRELGIEIITLDSPDEVTRALSLHAPIDAVLHAATVYDGKDVSTRDVVEANTHLPLALLDAALSLKVPRFINIDSALPPNTNRYALAKAHFREWGEQLVGGRDLSFINVAVQHFYGPGAKAKNFPAMVIDACRTGQKSLALTAGEQQRDFIHVDDVVSAVVTLAEHPLEHGFHSFDVGTGKAVRVRELVTLIRELTGSPIHLDFGALPYRPNEPMQLVADTSKLEALGWRCRLTLEEGLRQTIGERD